MRKATRILLIAVLIFAACLMLAACDDRGGVSFTYDNAEAYTVADSGSIDAVFSELEIDWFNGAVVVERGEAGSSVEFFEVTEGAEVTYDTTMRYLLDGFTLRIKYARSGRLVNNGLKKYLYMRIPADIRMREIDVESVSADITVRDIGANEVECSSSSGAIIVKCNNAQSVDVKSVSGDINVESTAYSIDVENKFGYSTIVCRTTPRELDVETETGDVLLRLAGDIGFTLEYETLNSGLFVNAFSENTVRHGRTYIYLNGACDYSVETRSGNLTIEKLAV